MEENLLGHLLGALDPVTNARVEKHLEKHPETQERLELLRQSLEPLSEDLCDPEPPEGLAQSTLAFIAKQVSPQPQPGTGTLPNAPLPSRRQIGVPARRWMRPADWLVAAGVFIFISGLAFPFLARQWQQQQRLACADNLRRYWVGLSTYSDRTQGEFPQVAKNGPQSIAGIFVPILLEHGLLPDVSIACPAQGHRPPLRMTVSDLEQLHRDQPDLFQTVARELAGHYAYSLGYLQGEQLVGLRRDSGDYFPIMADAGHGDGCSPNHLGQGQNVLYVGGQVRWCTEPTVGLERDNIYVNHRNRVQAGMCRIDSVLGASDARTCLGE